MTVSRLVYSFSAPKEALPTGTWMMFCLSRRYSILPALASVTALPRSGATVPALGLGIRPRGPSTLPRRPTRPIMSGVVTTTSKSMKPPAMRAISSSSPTMSAPAASAAAAAAPFAMAQTRTVLPVPLGRTTAPRTCWSAWRPSTPRRTCSSTVSSNLAEAVLQASSRASFTSYALVESTSFAAST